MKKTENEKQTTKKLKINKVTLRNLDEPTLDAMAGGSGYWTCALCTRADFSCGTVNTCLCQL